MTSIHAIAAWIGKPIVIDFAELNNQVSRYDVNDTFSAFSWLLRDASKADDKFLKLRPGSTRSAEQQRKVVSATSS